MADLAVAVAGRRYGRSAIMGGPANPLYVDAATGDDTRTKAQARSSLTPWQTIGRAAWGSTNRASPNASEAAAAGDTVLIAAGTYGSSVQLNNRLAVLYDPVNDGSVGNFITFMASGNVRLAAPALNAGVIGSVAGTYIRWYADRVTGKFLITCDGRFGTPMNLASSTAGTDVLTVNTSGAHGLTNGEQVLIRDHDCTPAIGSTGLQATCTVIDSDTFSVPYAGVSAGGGATGNVRRTMDTKADSTVVNPTPDTGPVVLNGCENCWFEGFDIDGGPQTDWSDNWSAFRLESTLNTTIRNCLIQNFQNSAASTNGAGVKHYSSFGTLIEHCDISNTGSGISIKDIPGGGPFSNGSYTFRRNRISNVASFFSWSETDEGGGDVTENLCVDASGHAMHMTGGDLNNDRIFNNTFVISLTGLYISTPQVWSNVKVWNNIFDGQTVRSIEYEGQDCPAATACSYEHNCYHRTSGQFYAGSPSGALSLAGFNAAFTDQHAAAPAAQDADPLFTDPGGGDYTLQGGSPAASMGRHPDTNATIDAGCYPSGVETVIGLENP